MTEPTTILCAKEGPVYRITLNRPEVLNALNGVMLREIAHAVSEAAADPDSSVVLIDSASDRAFSAGIDVAYVKDLEGFGVRDIGRELHRTFLTLRTEEIPIVCAIDGLCLGAGLELAISCDFMIATNRSQFGLPNIDRGIPAIVEAALLPLAVGIQGARELAYLGEFWDAEKAERRGLLYAVAAPEAFEAEVQSLVGRLAAKPATALATQKEIIHKWMTTDLESAIDFSINTVVLNWLTRDQQEGMASFLEKRDAQFKDTQFKHDAERKGEST
ncbi:MAG: enoyl-CoA hydratase/isomerase family protein [Acidimicrobiia bacterium]|nr:enoyl-CoA hydratase/isomerase family protein [Acidimicrobiia bacterium]